MKASRAESPQAAVATPRLRRTMWSEPQARALLLEQQRSGQTMIDFARTRGLSVKRLYWWKHRLAPPGAAMAASAPAFLPVRVLPEPRPSTRVAPLPVAASGASLEVVIGAGRVIRVGSDFDPTLLQRVIQTLEQKEEEAC